MLFCYFDDSGSDGESPIISVGGYAASTDAWEAFEDRVKPIFDAANVAVLHATEMNGSKGAFKGWPLAKKQAFVQSLYNEFEPRRHLGVGFSVTKAAYREAKKRENANHQISAYGFCLEAIYNILIKHESAGPYIREHGASIFVESGHPNSGDVERNYHALSKKYPEFSEYFRQLAFIDKRSCRAIQMADFFAFNFRRHSRDVRPEAQNPLWPPLIAHVINRCEHYGVVSFDYHRNLKVGGGG